MTTFKKEFLMKKIFIIFFIYTFTFLLPLTVKANENLIKEFYQFKSMLSSVSKSLIVPNKVDKKTNVVDINAMEVDEDSYREKESNLYLKNNIFQEMFKQISDYQKIMEQQEGSFVKADEILSKIENLFNSFYYRENSQIQVAELKYITLSKVDEDALKEQLNKWILSHRQSLLKNRPNQGNVAALNVFKTLTKKSKNDCYMY